MTLSSCTAFEGFRRITSGPIREVAAAAKQVIDRRPNQAVLVFDDATGKQVEIDFRGSIAEVLARLTSASGDTPAPEVVEPRRPGRPKLGVVAREITLLPRHWEWLGDQPGGASVALRKLVDEARRTSGPKEVMRHSREVAYRFMVALGGDLPGFEEATRALFGGDAAQFDASLEAWPVDVREHVQRLARPSFATSSQPV